MSFAVLEGRAPSDQMKEERLPAPTRALRPVPPEGLTPVHENCMNYGSMGYPFTLELARERPRAFARVRHRATPIFSDDRARPAPFPKQDSWEFYRQIKPHVAYVHIKDGV